MPRNIVEDVVPPEKRSIRSVPITRKTHVETQVDSTPTRVETHTIRHERVDYEDEPKIPAHKGAHSQHPQHSQHTLHATQVTDVKETGPSDKEDPWREIDREMQEKPKSLPRYILWGVVAVCVIIIIFFIAGAFTGATINITPRSETATVNTTLAGEEMSSSTLALFADSEEGTTSAPEVALGSVPYQVVTLSEQVSKSLPATGTQNISSDASGSIVIYNDYSATAQKLITNTRFETTSGLIFRIHAPVSIPGAKGSIPGSVTVKVYADQPGANYNIGLSDFTVPGLQGNVTEYKDVYARSATVMSGGASGVVAVASATDIANSKQAVETQIQDDLVKEVAASVSPQSVFYSNLAFMSYAVVNTTASSTASGTVNYTESGTVNAFVFDRDALASAIATKTLTDYDSTSVSIPQLDTLSVSLVTAAGDTTPWNDGEINFTISGSASIVWNYSQSDLKNAIAGQQKSDLPNILTAFPAVSSATASIRPFWKDTFPTDPNKITINTLSQ